MSKLIHPETGKLIETTELDVERVADRWKKRTPAEYEEMSKRMVRYAQKFAQQGYPKNVSDDMLRAALLLGEVYVARREGL